MMGVVESRRVTVIYSLLILARHNNYCTRDCMAPIREAVVAVNQSLSSHQRANNDGKIIMYLRSCRGQQV